MIKAFIFDLDGTLVDSLDDIKNTVDGFLIKHGWPTHSKEKYKKMVGNGFRNLILSAIPSNMHSHIEELHNEAFVVYKAVGVGISQPYEYAVQTLEAIQKQGIPMAVVSNKPDSIAKEVVATLFSKINFAFVQGSVDGKPNKPDPASALEAAAACKVAPTECGYVGDSDVDMMTAINAGMLPIGAAWGFRGINELKTAGAKIIVESWTEVLKLI